MSIEIKELHIKINIDDNSIQKIKNKQLESSNLKDIKSEIIKTCTRDILEILKEKQER